jgi:hypothetical protein
MLIDKPKDNYQNLPISTNSVATNTIDDKVEK